MGRRRRAGPSGGRTRNRYLDQIEAECQSRGWDLVAIEADEGVSAKTVKKREGLARAVAQLDKAKADVLVVTKLDRLSRSVIDFATLMERAGKKSWRIVVLDLGVDTTTPNGELVAGILAQVAQWERKLIGQRTKDALSVKKSSASLVQVSRVETVTRGSFGTTNCCFEHVCQRC